MTVNGEIERVCKVRFFVVVVFQHLPGEADRADRNISVTSNQSAGPDSIPGLPENNIEVLNNCCIVNK
jgi:hypothetical protein